MEDNIRLTKLASCAGCGAKVGAGVLARLLGDLDVVRDPNLLVGFDKSDDASVYKVSEDLALVQTVDFFPPIADDPYTFGAIAATNALSDVYAMGGEPRLALNVMAVPKDLPAEAVHELLRGGYEKCYEAGVIITGGHSILDPEPKYGLAVTGFVHPDKVLTNSGARPGDVLVLTKPLGIGVLTTANKAGLLEPETRVYAEQLMTTLNKAARDYTRELIVNHVSGRLKVAPEHTSDHVLEIMRKPSFRLFHQFKKIFDDICRRERLHQQIIPYFISSHPGCHAQDMADLAIETKDLDFQLEQVQDFTPTPLTVATTCWATGYHPYTLEPIFSAKTPKDKQQQRMFFFWYKKEERRNIENYLKQIKLVRILLGRTLNLLKIVL